MDQRGIDATTLVERSVVLRTSHGLDARELARWLTRSGFARRRTDGRLEATPLGAQVGAAIGPLGLISPTAK